MNKGLMRIEDWDEIVEDHKRDMIEIENSKKGYLCDEMLMIGPEGKPITIQIGQKIIFFKKEIEKWQIRKL